MLHGRGGAEGGGGERVQYCGSQGRLEFVYLLGGRRCSPPQIAEKGG